MVHPFTISGKVITGNQLGKKLGYPTANLDLRDGSEYYSLIGVYAATVSIGSFIYPGMANIGFRPTLERPSFTVEVNLFDFDQDLYGEVISIHFLEKIRDEIRFGTLDELAVQMKKDEELCRQVLSVLLKPDPDAI